MADRRKNPFGLSPFLCPVHRYENYTSCSLIVVTLKLVLTADRKNLQYNIQYNTTLLSLCREICFLARRLRKNIPSY